MLIGVACTTRISSRIQPCPEPELSALLGVVFEAAANLGEVSNVTWSAALPGGWSELELSEAFAHLAVNLFTDYVNHDARTDLDLPTATALTP